MGGDTALMVFVQQLMHQTPTHVAIVCSPIGMYKWVAKVRDELGPSVRVVRYAGDGRQQQRAPDPGFHTVVLMLLSDVYADLHTAETPLPRREQVVVCRDRV